MKSSIASIQSLLWDLFPIYNHIGLTVESVSNGLYRCRIPINDQNLNHIRTIHACIQWAAAEVLGGLVVIANLDHSRLFFVVRTVTIRFLKPARTDVSAEAFFAVKEIQDKLMLQGEAGFDLDAVIRDNHGTIVAETSAEYLIRKKRE